MHAHQRLENLPMILNAQVQKFVNYDEILKIRRLIGKFIGESDDTACRARPPFTRHPLNAYDPRSGV
jgi:hypothetical protein